METHISFCDRVTGVVLYGVNGSFDHLPRQHEHVLVEHVRYTVDRVEWWFDFTNDRVVVKVLIGKLMDEPERKERT
jgi:hypothetical protein